jgi:hypothetical protein
VDWGCTKYTCCCTGRVDGHVSLPMLRKLTAISLVRNRKEGEWSGREARCMQGWVHVWQPSESQWHRNWISASQPKYFYRFKAHLEFRSSVWPLSLSINQESVRYVFESQQ